MNPIGSEHEEIVDRLTKWSAPLDAAGKIRLRVQNSVGLPSLGSAPEPDIAWVVDRDYSRGRPTPPDVLLVIEVAESSLRYDCGEKAELYAEAGIADYWVVNVAERSIEVRRDPAAGRYRSLQTYQGDQEVRPLALPEAVLRPAVLWTTAV
jgi:Uma2 family endonuclease